MLYLFIVSDADECEESNVCEGGQCINMPGTYVCRCSGGVMPSLDHKSCIGKTLFTNSAKRPGINLIVKLYDMR